MITKLSKKSQQELLQKVESSQPGMMLDILATVNPLPSPSSPKSPQTGKPLWCVCLRCQETEEEELCCGHSQWTCIAGSQVSIYLLQNKYNYVLKGHSPFILAFEMNCYASIYGVKGFIFKTMSLTYKVILYQQKV